MSKINDYLIKYGFIYPSNEIYGRLQNLWDYGHLGVLLKENIKQQWIKFFVLKKERSFLYDGNIFTSEKVWQASGHLKNFHDILIDCKKCKKRFREDQIENKICPNCQGSEWTNSHEFNLMFKSNEYYLRPETAQTIFISFKNIINTTTSKLPFSISQIGKSFRNEVTISNSIFRTREFEQMEFEFFTLPQEEEDWFEHLLQDIQNFLFSCLKIKQSSIKLIDISEKDRAHYSKKSCDIFFNFEHGFAELWGLANRGNFDLLAHQTHSNTKLHYYDSVNNIKIIPHIIEHSVGLNRLFLAIITDAYWELNINNEIREVLKINPLLSPYKFAIFPLTKNELERSRYLYKYLLNFGISLTFEEKGSIGKRYKKQDLLGTPYCLTVDNESLLNDEDSFSFTIRYRDTMEQKRISIIDLVNYVEFFSKN